MLLGPEGLETKPKKILIQFKQYYMKTFISSLIAPSKVKKIQVTRYPRKHFLGW